MTTRIVTALTLATALLAAAPSPAADVPQGLADGIKVHDHWKVEVFEPDGSQVSTHEFENALVSGGGTALANSLTGTSAGGWVVLLASGSGVSKPCESWGVPDYCSLIEAGCDFGDLDPDSTNLTATAPPGNDALVLTGSVTAVNDSSIASVSTSVKLCNSSLSSLSCRTSTGGYTVAGFTLRQLDPEIAVLAGQLVQVTVTITFS